MGPPAAVEAIDLNPLKGQALATLDALRALVESGEVVAVWALGITPTDDVRAFLAFSRPVSKLRVLGLATHGLSLLANGAAGA